MWTAPRTWVTGELVTGSLLNTHLRDNLNSVVPIGSYLYRAAPYTDVETAVEGRWLQCNGVAVSRSAYSDLFDYLNSQTPALPFGSGDGTTTFNVPDVRGRSLYGQGTHSDVDVLGDNEGSPLAQRSGQHYHVVRVAQFTGNPGNLIAPVSAKDTGQTGTPAAVGPDLSRPAERGAYLAGGSYFIKYVL